MMMNKEKVILLHSLMHVVKKMEDFILEGYFIKYGVETELWPGFFELIEKKRSR